jgi:probable rRNA maturation factor
MITELNRLYLGRNHPTNVLSFALSEGAFGDLNPFLLGDIIISVERTLTDAQSAGLPFEDELDFLMIHGILHLIGYDHENVSVREKRRMHEKEKDLFYRLKGYPLKR